MRDSAERTEVSSLRKKDGMSQMQQIILFWDVSKIIPVKGKPFLESLKDYLR